ncbi:MAG: OmpA family protein [Polyangiaceae bacterium]|nr:OmpA family protein [Polyangiaceae bacterium]MCB9609980.1 OmpA family protein [Polyangiaceae bacterium]
MGPGVGAAVTLIVAITGLGVVSSSVSSAKERLVAPEAEKPKVAVANQAEVGYCTPRFKEVLERVLHSCGLSAGEDRRGCKPADVKTFASISDEDFNELFTPLKERGAVLMFDTGKDELDPAAQKLLDEKWFERKGARYFFVVARASKTGTQSANRALSHRRANSVMFHIKQTAKDDPEVDKKVGLLWLGNEFAQFSKSYCAWNNSRPDKKCDEDAINRSAFVSWVDCRL